MSKRKDRKQVEELYQSLVRAAGGAAAEGVTAGGRELPRLKKFRFQLLHAWMVEHLEPCRVADVGGGKGLLTYLLRQSGWEATVIDPAPQGLPGKYRNLTAREQLRIRDRDQVPRIARPFEPGMAREFDLLVAMHAHGCIVRVIDAAAEHGRRAIVLPCCVIDEPLIPAPGVHWLRSVLDYAMGQGFRAEPFRLNFKGQNIGLCLRRVEESRSRRNGPRAGDRESGGNGQRPNGRESGLGTGMAGNRE